METTKKIITGHQSPKTCDLLILGSVGLDDVKTPFGEVKSVLGGSASYASCAASFFARPSMIGPFGSDMPSEAIKLLKKKKIDISGLVKTESKTFRWSGLYEYDMNEAKTLKTELNALADFVPLLSKEHLNPDFLFLANIDTAQQKKVLDQVKNRPFVLIDTMNYWINSRKTELLELLKQADMIVMNEEEARQLFNTPNLIKAGKEMLKLGAKYAVVKKGEHGALLFSKNDFFSAPGYPLEEVKDPTGAGDSFAGALIGYLAKTKDLSENNVRKAVVYGSVIASFCAEDFSLNYLKNINKKKIKERYDVFKKIRKF